MARVCSSILFFILCHMFILLIAQVTSQQGFLYHFCVNDRGNYTRNSTYEANLNHLLSTLPSQEGNGYGFYNLSYGNSSDKVYTIALCRGDAKPDACRSCLNDSTHLLPQICPDQKEAVGWYDNCMLRYSNQSMFGIVETSHLFYMKNNQNVTDADGFYEKLRTLIDQLKNQAAAGDSLRKFATGNDTTPEFKTIYALVQCTPDLSKEQCNNCLDSVFGIIPQCCDGRKGARVVGPSCNVRYEDYLFYESTANTPPTSPPLLSPAVSPPPPTSTNTTPTQARPLYEPVEEIESAESLQYNFDTIKVAADYFSEANKLGRVGFGSVYRGRLSDGEEIAVKRLSRGSGQGDLEFKNEVLLVVNLQHRNLVRLLGFCLEGNERLLVYEFVPNASLDHFIFDPSKHAHLNWERHYKIIGGVSRGLLCLHEDSRLRIIHRDLKASNILLDEEMNPKNQILEWRDYSLLIKLKETRVELWVPTDIWP